MGPLHRWHRNERVVKDGKLNALVFSVATRLAKRISLLRPEKLGDSGSITVYSVETHRLQMSFIHIGGSLTHAKLGSYYKFVRNGPPASFGLSESAQPA